MIETPMLRAALIVDGPTLPAWAADATQLAMACGRMQVVAIFICTNNVSHRALVSHFGYYAMRATLMRPRAFRPRKLGDIMQSDVETEHFVAEYDGAWQRIPETMQLRAAALNLDVAIKFGMGLLRDPHRFPARFGILSYHHGDPCMYRGRPVGFYELDDNAPHIGAVVQRLTNTLDGGEFLAEGRFRIERHSYRGTLESLYTGSSCLLEKALAVCTEPPTSARRQLGKNHRLPSNSRVARFLLKLLIRNVGRLAYGAFGRKQWRLFEAALLNVSDLTGDTSLNVRPLPLPSGVKFVADPFYLDSQGGTLVCERMENRSAHGDIVRIEIGRGTVTPLVVEHQRHLSYPCVFRWNDRIFIVPEIAAWSAPLLLELDADATKIVSRTPLQGVESERLLDPTLLEYDGAFWLFASPEKPYRKMDTLLLWRADQLHGPYTPHPMNPVVLDPSSARQGGRVLVQDNTLIRFGQDNSAGYGAGLAVMQIEELTPTRYRERQIGRVKLEGIRGPHTIDFAPEKSLVDGYRDVIDPFAWVQRLRERLQ